MSDKQGPDRDSRVRERAYQLWEQEGCPAGRHEDHWHDAARLIDADPIAGAEPEAVPAAERGSTETPKAKRAPRKPAEPEAGAVKRARAPRATPG